MKNVTLSLPDELLEKSRAYAKAHGSSLNEFIRELLRKQVLTDMKTPVDQLLERSREVHVSTKGWKWNRDELYDRKIFS